MALTHFNFDWSTYRSGDLPDDFTTHLSRWSGDVTGCSVQRATRMPRKTLALSRQFIDLVGDFQTRIGCLTVLILQLIVLAPPSQRHRRCWFSTHPIKQKVEGQHRIVVEKIFDWNRKHADAENGRRIVLDRRTLRTSSHHTWRKFSLHRIPGIRPSSNSAG
jgi:hypothetical protein